ncbi:MAG: hypothetical protein A2287_07690 [Candidatus Melainabacteria bacterium RIFOXYA12_FULL_32_12]|nr:MAG: hypothetical protein A2255_07720 [Candidatus Melainabacteria bacterium RIFOXYA2_FULL_32_9]OGI30708.1 MAG: hypothetical protein A2287_07690 [Candidatus Melainabacteria bacterium RIFOXYA12_FULL_32_12]
MGIDVKKSFRFIFSDSEWPQKIAIGGLFFFGAFLVNIALNVILDRVIIPQLNLQLTQFDKSMIQTVLDTLVNIPVLAFAMGYIIQSAHNEVKNETPLLPNWDSKFFNYFKTGFIYYLINIGYYFFIVLIAVIIGLLVMLFSLILNFNFNVSNAAGAIGGILGLLFAIVSPFITLFYADNFNWKDAFKLREIFNAISKVFSDYLISFGILAGLWILWLPVYLILTFTCIGAIIPQFLVLIVHLITVNLFAQTYKEYKQIT